MDGPISPDPSVRQRERGTRQLLPVEAYTSQAWFEREQRELFTKTWSFCGMTEDVARPGDYTCVEIGGAPYVLIRDEQNQLRGYHNLCRHRGSRLLEGSGNTGSVMVCFYHRWSYALDGSLLGVPQARAEFPGLDKSCHGLLPVQVACWRNLIFINPDLNAAPLESWLAGAPEQMLPHDPANLVEVGDLLYRIKANWKVVAENFFDSYHLFYLHENSLADGDFDNLRQWPTGRHWHEKRGLKPGISHDKMMLPVIDGISPTFGFAAVWLFPTVALVAQAHLWLTFHVIPVSAEVSLVNLRIRGAPAALDRPDLPPPVDQAKLPDYMVHAKGPYTAVRLDSTEVHPLESASVMREDIYACEAMQEGMHSPRWAVGPLSSWEESLSFFQQQILDFVPL